MRSDSINVTNPRSVAAINWIESLDPTPARKADRVGFSIDVIIERAGTSILGLFGTTLQVGDKLTTDAKSRVTSVSLTAVKSS